MSETQTNDEVAKNILNLIDLAQTVASLPITKLTNDEVAVLQEIARQHLTQKTLMEALAVTDADLARTSLTLKDDDGNMIVGRKVEKVAVNMRLDKQLGMKKTDWIRMALWHFAERNNVATKAAQRTESEATQAPAVEGEPEHT